MRCEFKAGTRAHCTAKAVWNIRWKSSPKWEVEFCDLHKQAIATIPYCIVEPIEEEEAVT